MESSHKDLTHISLFAGIGGIDIAAEWAGFRTILFVEIDPFCQRVLKKHWPSVPIIGDIKDATKEAIANTTGQRPHNKKDEQELEGERGDELHAEQPRVDESRGDKYSAISPVTLVTGGFPCQSVSQAGKRRGKEDDRWLWPEMLRVISEVRPAWVVAENVAGLLYLGFHDCLSDLEGAGYETIPFVIPACSVNAPHKRDRIFIVANSKCQRRRGRYNGDEGRSRRSLQIEGSSAGDKQKDVADTQGGRLRQKLSKFSNKLLPEDSTPQEFESSSGDVSNTGRERLQGAIYPRNSNSQAGSIKPGSASTRTACKSGKEQWATEPDVGRVAYGIPNRVDRLRALGNAVVPQQIYPILKAIADIENG